MQLNFNASQHNPQTTPEPVDTAWYPVTITSAEEKPNKAGSGSYLELGLTIQQGPNARRVVKARLNLRHPNPQTVEIAQGELSAICHVTGRMQLQHAQQLLGANMQAYIVKAPRNDRPGQFSNDVQGYRDMNGNEPGQGGNHGGFAGQGGQQQGQNQNYGGQQGGYDPNANQQGGNGGWQGNNQQGGFDPNAQQGGNAGGYQQNNNGYQQNNNGGGFDPNNQQGGGQGGYQQGQNGGGQGGGYQQNQQGNGQNQNFGGNGNGQGGNQQGNGGPAGGGNMPSWA